MLARQISLNEMCEITGFSPSAMRSWCLRDDTPAYKFGRLWRCDENELYVYIWALQNQEPPSKVINRSRINKKPYSRNPADWGLKYVHGR